MVTPARHLAQSLAQRENAAGVSCYCHSTQKVDPTNSNETDSVHFHASIEMLLLPREEQGIAPSSCPSYPLSVWKGSGGFNEAVCVARVPGKR